jgi:hypothetical protein
MPSTLSLPGKWPMLLVDQFGVAAGYAWFPPGTATGPAHVLPPAVYAAVCRTAGADPTSPWVMFGCRSEATSAVAAAAFATVQSAGR